MEKSEQSSQPLCPSAKCQDGAQLIGVVKENGHIDMLKEAIKIDQTFVDIAKQGRIPEMRFRFANKCIKSGCRQWAAGRCGVVDKIIDHVSSENQVNNNTLPECSIRPACRWYLQTGPEACMICPFVITDISEIS